MENNEIINWDTPTATKIVEDINNVCEELKKRSLSYRPDVCLTKKQPTPEELKIMKQNLRKIIESPPGKTKLEKKFNRTRAKAILNRLLTKDNIM